MFVAQYYEKKSSYTIIIKSFCPFLLYPPVWPMNNPRHRRAKTVEQRATPVIVSCFASRTWKINNNWFV